MIIGLIDDQEALSCGSTQSGVLRHIVPCQDQPCSVGISEAGWKSRWCCRLAVV